MSNAIVTEIKVLGQGKHLKLRLESENHETSLEAIAFGMGERAKEIRSGQMIDIVYTIDENIWNGKTSLQLKVKDFKVI